MALSVQKKCTTAPVASILASELNNLTFQILARVFLAFSSDTSPSLCFCRYCAHIFKYLLVATHNQDALPRSRNRWHASTRFQRGKATTETYTRSIMFCTYWYEALYRYMEKPKTYTRTVITRRLYEAACSSNSDKNLKPRRPDDVGCASNRARAQPKRKGKRTGKKGRERSVYPESVYTTNETRKSRLIVRMHYVHSSEGRILQW